MKAAVAGTLGGHAVGGDVRRAPAPLPPKPPPPRGQLDEAPLPGGVPLVSKPRRASGTAAPSGQVQAHGVVGSIWQLFGRGASPVSDGDARQRTAALQKKADIASKAQSQEPHKDKPSPGRQHTGKVAQPSAGVSHKSCLRRRLNVRSFLFCTVLLGCAASAPYWVLHHWVPHHDPAETPGAPAAGDSPAEPAQHAEAGAAVPEAEAEKDGETLAEQLAAEGAITALRSEIATLKQSLERHDQMLRYIMDRFVEKENTPTVAKFPDVKRSAQHDLATSPLTGPEVEAAIKGGRAREPLHKKQQYAVAQPDGSDEAHGVLRDRAPVKAAAPAVPGPEGSAHASEGAGLAASPGSAAPAAQASLRGGVKADGLLP